MRYVLLSGIEKDKVFESMYHTNICNGFSIYDPKENYFDYFGFGGDRDNHCIKNYCINRLSAFEDFIISFREKISHVLNLTDQSRLIAPNKLVSLEQVKRHTIIERNKIKY